LEEMPIRPATVMPLADNGELADLATGGTA
jgi:hypothetical protein